MTPRSPASGRSGAGIAAVLGIGVPAAAMLAWSWRKWPDVLVDFGQQLYLAQRIAAGDALYRDLAYFNGPLAPYLNGLWFWAFGPSLMTLVCANALVLAAITLLLYGLLRRVGGALSATAGGIVFVTLFACAQYLAYGNYNYLSPYEHAVTYGLLCALLAVTASLRALARDAATPGALAGLGLGLAFLTKIEYFAAGSAAVATAVGASAWLGRLDGRAAARLAIATLAAPALAVAALATVLPPGEALAGVLTPVRAVLASDVASLHFFRWRMGTLELGASMIELLRWSGLWLLFFAPALGFAFWRPRRGATAWVAAVAVLGGIAWLALRDAPTGAWVQSARPLPLLVAIASAVELRALVRTRARPEQARRHAARLAVLLFALALLAKMLFRTTIAHYGFVLAAPAALLAVAMLADWIPEALASRGARPAAFRAIALALLAIAGMGHLQLVARRFAEKDVLVASGADAFWADRRGRFVSRMLDEIGQRTPADATLVALPEGAMLNYLSRRRNPTPFTNFMPTEVAIFGEQRMLAALQRDPPDFLALVHKDTAEFGVRFFGRDYGRAIGEWVRSHYEPVVRLGAPPLEGPSFGIWLLRRAGDPALSPLAAPRRARNGPA